MLTLNDVEQGYTRVGRGTGLSQLVGMCLIETTVADSKLTLRNPFGNATSLTITPNAGGAGPVSAHIVITRLS